MSASKIFSNQTFESAKVENIGCFELVYYTGKSPIKDTPNEDSIAITTLSDDVAVLMIADGAGGHPKGEMASNQALEIISKEVAKARDSSADIDLRTRILDGIESANDFLITEGSGSKTTITVCELSGRTVRTYQIGDSGLIISGQKGKLKYKTVFHSPVGYGVEAGLIEDSEALEHPDLNEISNILGDREMTVEMGPKIDLDDRDTILLASDGVFDNYSTDDLTELIRKGSLEEIGSELSNLLSERLEGDPEGQHTKYDDLSFILCRLNV